jgi:mannosyltransferase
VRSPTVLSRRTVPVGLALVALTGLAVLLTLHGLGTKSIDFDEAVSVEYGRSGAVGLWGVVSGGDPNMGLYYALLDVWMRIFGDSEAAVRSLSAVAGALAVPVAALLGIRLFGRRAGLIAGLLLALNAFFVQYAQWARGYGLAPLLVTLSSYCFVAELERPSRANRVGYVLASALAVYAHYFTVLVLLVQLLTLVAVRGRAALRRDWLVTGAAVLMLCAPAAVFATRADTRGLSWIKPPGVGDLLHLPVELTGGGVALAAGLLALAVYAVARSLGDRDRWRTGFVAAWLVLPVLLAFAASLVQPMFVSYYLIVTLPAFALLAGAGIARLPGRVAGVAALVAVVALSVVRIADWYAAGSPENYRETARRISAGMRPSDGIVYDPPAVAHPIAYYERRAAAAAAAAIDARGSPARAGSPPRLWLVMRDAATAERRRLERTTLRAYEPVARPSRVGRVSLALYRRRSRPGP